MPSQFVYLTSKALIVTTLQNTILEVRWARRLYLRVGDIAENSQRPMVSHDADIRKVIVEISEKMLGAAAVLQDNKIVGIITDGDIRRMLNKYDSINGLQAKDIMTLNPKTVANEVLAIKALNIMQEKGISQVLAVDGENYSGVVHLHNLMNEGIL